MEKITQHLANIAEQCNGFSFAEPWRYSDESIVAVLPILRESEAERAYITLVEAGEQVAIVEKGSINEMIVKNDGDMPVFLRTGEMLKGATQGRAIIMSQILMPKEERSLEVVCVHASRSLASGAIMASAGYTPAPVTSTLYRCRAGGISAYASQGETWAAVANAGNIYTASLESLENPDFQHWSTSDDLVAMHDSYAKAIGDILNKVPRFENQVGLATLGTQGLLGLQCPG